MAEQTGLGVAEGLESTTLSDGLLLSTVVKRDCAYTWRI